MEDIKLWHGDCLELMKDIPDKSVDAIICDLPYGSTKCSWDSIIPFDELWEQYNRIVKDNGAICLFGSGMFTANLMISNRDMWRYNLIWQKTTPTGFLNSKRQPLRSHEDICLFYKKQPTYNPQKTKGNKRKVSLSYHKRNSKKTEIYGKYDLFSYDSTERFPKSILTFKTDKQKLSIHPTQKPVSLIEYLIKTYSNEGDLILDNAAGSMTTAIAAINTNRRCICIEKDDHYFEIGSDRVRKHLQNKQLSFFDQDSNQ